MSHRNARLTVPWPAPARAAGPRSRACRSPMSPRRWGSHASARIVGSPGSTPRATPGCTTGRSRPHSMPTRTSAEVEAAVVAARVEHRRGPGLARPRARRRRRGPSSRILRRHDVPRLCELRPADRRRDPRLEDHRGPLRTGPARRAGPHGRQEDRPDPRRRRLASPRPRDGLNLSERKKATDRLRLRPLPRRRPQPPRLLRDPRRRTRRHLRRVLRPSRRRTSPPTASTDRTA